jgi:toxin ParE1/3/4
MILSFFPQAKQELLEAASQYEEKVHGLGSDFVNEVERIADIVLRLPTLGEKLDPVHRRIPLRRFPYAVIFRQDNDVIHIVAVAHRRRKPQYWQPRVQDR